MQTESKRDFGTAGEDIAVKFLLKNQYTILERNFRVGRMGEIDIIARESEYICFVEVKTRSSIFFGLPCEAVNKRKQESIIKLAQVYLKQHGLKDINIRFDIVEIIVNKRDSNISVKDINIIKNAF